jgi:hypothetical protein
MANAVIFIHMQQNQYSHVLQKTGILKNFTVAKIVKKREIDDLKKLIKKVAASEEEYKTILNEEMHKISNMHDQKNPIPGIIYGQSTPPSSDTTNSIIYNITKRFCASLKHQNFTDKELAFLVTAIINELGLTKEDFLSLRDELNNEENENGAAESDPDEDSPPPPETEDDPPKF